MESNEHELKTDALTDSASLCSENQKRNELHVHIYIGSEEFGVIAYKALVEAAERGLIPRIV